MSNPLYYSMRTPRATLSGGFSLFNCRDDCIRPGGPGFSGSLQKI